MNWKALPLVLVAALVAVPAPAQETPTAMVAAYDALADNILAVRAAEAGFVLALLDGHRHAARMLKEKGDWQGAAAQVALFATEGDNAVAGVRKRLLEGGHHFNAAGEEQGIFEPGFVIVTREAKEKLLKVASDLRQATTDEARQEAWGRFRAVANQLLKQE